MRIPREAIAKLTKEGLVNPRQSVGAIVLERGDKVWRGNILLITNGYDFVSYSEERFAAEFRNRLYEGHCLYSYFAFPGDESVKRFDYSALEVVLRQPIDLCVVRWGCARLYRLLEKHMTPFLAMATHRPRYSQCMGVIHSRRLGAAVSVLVRACKAEGVHKVACFDYDMHNDTVIADALEANGIIVDRHSFPLAAGRERLEATSYGGLQGMRGYLSKNGRCLPDLLYFSDDYLASGALVALSEARVDVPSRTKVVTLTNRGNMPVWSKGLARIEVDTAAEGRLCAEYALAMLEGRDNISAPILEGRFIPGETFPVNNSL